MRHEPDLRHSETYTESNFLRLATLSSLGSEASGDRVVTLEHFCYRPAEAQPGGWQCRTIIDRETMTKDDAVFIAQAYAREHAIPVIYECHEG